MHTSARTHARTHIFIWLFQMESTGVVINNVRQERGGFIRTRIESSVVDETLSTIRVAAETKSWNVLGAIWVQPAWPKMGSKCIDRIQLVHFL